MFDLNSICPIPGTGRGHRLPIDGKAIEAFFQAINTHDSSGSSFLNRRRVDKRQSRLLKQETDSLLLNRQVGNRHVAIEFLIGYSDVQPPIPLRKLKRLMDHSS